MANTKISALALVSNAATRIEALPANFGEFPAVRVANASNYKWGLYQTGYGLGRRTRDTFFGVYAGYLAPVGGENTFIGANAGLNATGVGTEDNVFVGTDAGQNQASIYNYENTFVGWRAGQAGVAYGQNTFIGSGAGIAVAYSDRNVFVGRQAGANANTFRSVFIGAGAGASNTGSETVAIGLGAGATNTGDGCAFVGTVAGSVNQGDHNTLLGYYAGRNLTGATNEHNTFVGAYAGETLPTPYSYNNTFSGFAAGRAQTGIHGVFIGADAGTGNNGSYNVLIGSRAGIGIIGSQNTVVGRRAAQALSGSGNTVVGERAGEYATATAALNVFVGRDAGQYAADDNRCTFLGYRAGRRTYNSTRSVAIGPQALAGDAATSYLADDVIAIGSEAGRYQAYGNSNIWIGSESDVTTPGGWVTGVVCIGHTASIAAGADSAVAIGNQARNRITRTCKIRGPLITTKTGGVSTAPYVFDQNSAAQVTLCSDDVDLTAAATQTITIPTGAVFYLDEVSVIATDVAGLVSQPTISAGISGNNTKYVGPVACTNLTVSDTREQFAGLAGVAGEQTLTGTVDVGAVAGTFRGRFQFKGVLIEQE